MPAPARPWHAFYDPGVRTEIEQPPFQNLAEFGRSIAQRYGAATAFTCCLPNGMAGALSFAELDRLSDAFAVYLREVAGLAQGDRVAIQVPNSLPYPIVAFGVFKAGCVLVNVNPLYTAEEMGKQFADSEPKALVIIDLFADKLPAALAMQPIPHVVVTRVAELFPLVPRTIVGLVQKYLKKQVPACTTPHTTFEEAIRRGRERLDAGGIDALRYAAETGPSDLACLQYTGGTTGTSKGAMLTHGNLIMNMAQTMELVGPRLRHGEEVILTALPLYHIFAFTVNFIGFYSLGAHNVLVPSPRPLTNLKKAFEKFPITATSGVNTLFNGLNNEAWFRENPPKTLKCSVAGGMALHRAVAERWQEITGTQVIEGYGLTESSPVLSFNPFDKNRPDTIGVPIPSTDMRCMADDGTEAPVGQPGELVARGPQVMAGYWRRPEETRNVLRDGWLYTGDIGTMDADGYFRIVDRKKDMILVSGFNVYPNEVEECLAKHPAVLEAAVVGVPDGAAGEAVKAFVVVRKDHSMTADEVQAHCREHLAAYKVPKRVEFRTELPKSNVGKILRKDLREPPAQVAAAAE
jgi:long-chain acyl-CoA synthetase